MWKDIFIFAAGAVMTALGLRLARGSPFWDWVILASVIATVLSASHGFTRVRLAERKLDPFLTVAVIGIVTALTSLGLYIVKGSSPLFGGREQNVAIEKVDPE